MNYVDLKDYIYLIYEMSVDGDAKYVTHINLDESIPAHGEGKIKLSVSVPDKGKCYLRVFYYLKNGTPLMQPDTLLGFDEILLTNADGRNQKAAELLTETETDDILTVEENDKFFTSIP